MHAVQGLKVHGILPASQVLSALEILVAQPNSTVVKEHEVRFFASTSCRTGTVQQQHEGLMSSARVC